MRAPGGTAISRSATSRFSSMNKRYASSATSPLLVDRALEHGRRRDLVQRAEGGWRVGERLEALGGEETRNSLQVRNVAQVVRMPLREPRRVRKRHFGDVD